MHCDVETRAAIIKLYSEVNILPLPQLYWRSKRAKFGLWGAALSKRSHIRKMWNHIGSANDIHSRILYRWYASFEALELLPPVKHAKMCWICQPARRHRSKSI